MNSNCTRDNEAAFSHRCLNNSCHICKLNTALACWALTSQRPSGNRVALDWLRRLVQQIDWHFAFKLCFCFFKNGVAVSDWLNRFLGSWCEYCCESWNSLLHDRTVFIDITVMLNRLSNFVFSLIIHRKFWLFLVWSSGIFHFLNNADWLKTKSGVMPIVLQLQSDFVDGLCKHWVALDVMVTRCRFDCVSFVLSDKV